MAVHKHWFHALSWHLGQFGRQDVHIHSCVEERDNDEHCDRVLVGPGRRCDQADMHVRKTLGQSWSARMNEGRPLERVPSHPTGNDRNDDSPSRPLGAVHSATHGDQE